AGPRLERAGSAGVGVRRLYGGCQRSAAAPQPACRRRRSGHAGGHRRERHAGERARGCDHPRRPHRRHRLAVRRFPGGDLRRPRLGGGRPLSTAVRDRASSPPVRSRGRATEPTRRHSHPRGHAMSKYPALSILTANRLADGTVVFLDFEGAWSESPAEAVVARSPDEARALEDRGAYDAARNLVVDPYLVEVRETVRGLVPVRTRERVRIGGPSVLDDVPGYVSPEAP